MDSETIKTVKVNSEDYDVVGYIEEDTPANEYDCIDIFHAESGECINMGDSFFEIPTMKEIEGFVESWDRV